MLAAGQLGRSSSARVVEPAEATTIIVIVTAGQARLEGLEVMA
jgi:hypothetical protein